MKTLTLALLLLPFAAMSETVSWQTMSNYVAAQGAGTNGVTAAQAATINNAVTNTQTGVTLNGTFTGNGAGLTGLPTTNGFVTASITNQSVQAQAANAVTLNANISAGTNAAYVGATNYTGNALKNTFVAAKLYPVTPRLGFIATRGRFNEHVDAGGGSWMYNRTVHIARDNIPAIQVVWFNSTTEDTAAGAATITAAVEYPSNTITQITFSGIAKGAMASGKYVASDLVTLPVSIPPGAMFWIRSFYTNASQNFFYSQKGNPAFDIAAYGTSAQTDPTMVNPFPGDCCGGGSVVYFPAAIIGITALPSVLGIGDSRMWGAGDTVDNSLMLGAERYIGAYYGFANQGESGETLAGFISYPTNRLFLTNFASVVDFELGINGIGTNTYSQYTNALSLFGTIPVIGTTLEPNTTSSDSWATIAGQTSVYGAADTNRVNLNTMLRNGQMPGIQSIIDEAAVVEYGTNSGLWVANGLANFFTADGVHTSINGQLFISHGIPSIFTPATPTLGVGGGIMNGPLIVNSTLSASSFTGNGNPLTNLNAANLNGAESTSTYYPSNAWSANLAPLTNGMTTGAFKFANSNGVPVMLWYSNAVLQIEYKQ